MVYSAFMFILSFVLNCPHSLFGIIFAIISMPTSIRLSRRPFALIFKIKSYWAYAWLPGKKGVRASAIGYVVCLSPLADKKDLAHELVHVQQAQRTPLIYPILYAYQSLRCGYTKNKYEVGAYTKSGSRYTE